MKMIKLFWYIVATFVGAMLILSNVLLMRWLV